jgi:RNA-directed DNA polymerase
MVSKSVGLTCGGLSASAPRWSVAVGIEEAISHEMTKGRETKDGRAVPEGCRKAVPTAGGERGGKATTASKQAEQLELFLGTADNPEGNVAAATADLAARTRRAVPKPRDRRRRALPAMTMEEVASYENLKEAWKRVKENDGAPGPDRQSIEKVGKHLGEVLRRLQGELLAGSYRPGMIRRAWIPKPDGGKRGLGIPDVIDRVVQQSVYQVLGPHYDPTFHKSSHGFRPERSCHTAITEAQQHMREGYGWVVDLDLERFFDKVNHQRLVARLEERVKDRRIIQLIWRMLKAKVVMPDGLVVSTEEGTPQGGPLSPLLSNIVLDELDRELERRGHRFVRYADDANIYVKSERAGQRVMAGISQFIERRLRLKVNLAKSAVARPEERHFLGFRLQLKPDRTTEVLLSKRSLDRIREKVRELTPRMDHGPLEARIRRVNAYVAGWTGFFWVCTAAEERTFHNLDAHIRRRLRAGIVRDCKRKRTIVKRVIKLGVKRDTAWRSIYRERKSWWALSHCYAVDRALSSRYFEERGLRSLQRERAYRHAQAIIVSRQPRLPFGTAVGGNTGARLRVGSSNAGVPKSRM